MSIGNPLTKVMIDSAIGPIHPTLIDLFNGAAELLTQINALPGGASSALIAMGYTSGDTPPLMNGLNDIINLGKVYAGSMYVAAGATVNTGVPTNNDGTHFGYPFRINIAQGGGIGT